MLSKEEKEAIEILKEVASDEFSTIGDDISPKMAQNILNVISRQQKEIEEKNIAINKMSKDISRQLEEIEEKTTILLAGAEKVKQLEKEIEELKSKYKDLFFQNFELWEKSIFPKQTIEKEYISKDKIRELKQKVKKEKTSNPYDFIYMLDELLEEK